MERRSNLSRYGLTVDEYWEMFDRQEGVCAICRRPELRTRRDGHRMNLCIDHNHATGMIRELLCSLCNVMLGASGDSPDLLTTAIEYLNRHEPEQDDAKFSVPP